MGKRDALVFQIASIASTKSSINPVRTTTAIDDIEQQSKDDIEQQWNIVGLETQRQLHHELNELIRLCAYTTITTSTLQQQLQEKQQRYGCRFAQYLVRALQIEDDDERQAVVWLLTLLQDPETLPMLRAMIHNTRLSRATRLSASLTLAGLGATPELTDSAEQSQHLSRLRLYAIG
jgi:hypothetical protein